MENVILTRLHESDDGSENNSFDNVSHSSHHSIQNKKLID